jgi:O-antigen/teichoic acid export membrane protein
VPPAQCRLGCEAQVIKNLGRRTRAGPFLSDSLTTLAARVGGKGLSALTVVFAARFLGVDAFGEYVALAAAVTIGASFGDLGLGDYVTYKLAVRPQDGRPLSAALRVRAPIAAALVVLATLLTALVRQWRPMAVPAIALSLSGGLDLLAGACVSALRGHQLFRRAAYVAIFRSATLLCLVIPVLYVFPNITAFSLAILGSAFCGFAMSWFLTPGSYAALRTRTPGIGWLLRELWPYAVCGVLFILYFRIDVLLLAKLSALSEVGIYGAAYKMLEACLLAPSIFGSVLLPYFGAAISRSGTAWQECYDAALDLTLWGSLVVVSVLSTISGPLVRILYGKSFSASVGVFNILVLALFLMMITGGVHAAALLSTEVMRQATVTSALAVCVNVVSNLVLIPLLAARGAALSTVASEVVMLAGNFYLLNHKGLKARAKRVALPALAAVLVLVGSLAGGGWHFFALVVVAPAAVMFLRVAIKGLPVLSRHSRVVADHA